MTSNVKELDIKRYDSVPSPSLRAWNAADELLVDFFEGLSDHQKEGSIILNDRFGFLTTHLYAYEPTTFCHLFSQQNSIVKNLTNHGFRIQGLKSLSPFEGWPKSQVVLLQMPKSLDFFEWLLRKSVVALEQSGQVAVGFMTKYFSDTFLKIAGQYFGEIEQTKAHKKARLLILKAPKQVELQIGASSTINFEGFSLSQFPGVFSKDRVDSATQFLLEHVQVDQNVKSILDFACGSGVIAAFLKSRYPGTKICAADDFTMAIAAAKLNLSDTDEVIWSDGWGNLQDRQFDLIVTNPPFHFEYEVNLMLPIQMMKDAHDHLNPSGSLWIVSNRHINYKSHLEKVFSRVEILQQNKKFEITRALK